MLGLKQVFALSLLISVVLGDCSLERVVSEINPSNYTFIPYSGNGNTQYCSTQEADCRCTEFVLNLFDLVH